MGATTSEHVVARRGHPGRRPLLTDAMREGEDHSPAGSEAA